MSGWNILGFSGILFFAWLILLVGVRGRKTDRKEQLARLEEHREEEKRIDLRSAWKLDFRRREGENDDVFLTRFREMRKKAVEMYLDEDAS